MKKLLRVGEVAEWLGLNEATIRRYAKLGRIQCFRDINGNRRFDVKEVQRFENAFLTKELSPST